MTARTLTIISQILTVTNKNILNAYLKNLTMGFGNVVNYIVYDNPLSKATISLFTVSLVIN